jgi:hypothetical protein
MGSRQRIVTPFAGAVVRAMMRLAGYGDSGADARTQDHGKDHVMTSAGTVDSFGHSKAVGVVGDPDFAPQRTA